MKVLIQVGHTSRAQGAGNKASGMTEFAFNTKVAEAIMRDKTHEYHLISDVDLNRVPALVNQINPDICIALHCNAFNESATGTETLYWHTSTKGKALAQRLQKSLVEALGLKDRGVKPITGTERGGFLLKGTKCPAVIVEPFFIDSADYEKFKDQHDLIAQAIIKGI